MNSLLKFSRQFYDLLVGYTRVVGRRQPRPHRRGGSGVAKLRIGGKVSQREIFYAVCEGIFTVDRRPALKVVSVKRNVCQKLTSPKANSARKKPSRSSKKAKTGLILPFSANTNYGSVEYHSFSFLGSQTGFHKIFFSMIFFCHFEAEFLKLPVFQVFPLKTEQTEEFHFWIFLGDNKPLQ